MTKRPRLKTIRVGLTPIDTRTVKPMKKAPDPFYVSPAWRKLMEELYAERGRTCEECGRTSTRLFGDHIVELRDGGAPLDKANVKIMCGSCHQKKSAIKRGERMRERYE